MTDEELLAKMLDDPDLRERVGEHAATAFDSIRARGIVSEKQRAWIRGAAERLGIATAPSENLFSKLSPERQREQRERAAKVRLPWEK